MYLQIIVNQRNENVICILYYKASPGDNRMLLSKPQLSLDTKLKHLSRADNTYEKVAMLLH